MATMIRKQIYLEADQDARLKKLAQETGQSEAEIIRHALERHAMGTLPKRTKLQAWLAERAYIEQLMQQGPVVGARTWTRDELYER